MTINDIRNVPVPKKPEPKPGEQANGFSLDDIESRELRIILFDLQKNEFISNAHIIPASATADGKTWLFGDISEAVQLAAEVTFKNEAALSSKAGKTQAKSDVHVVFELVLVLKQGGDNGGKLGKK